MILDHMYVLSACVIILVLNSIFMYFQMEEVQSSYARVRAHNMEHYVAVGKHRAMFKKGSIAIISVNKSGIVELAEVMEGFTILAKFKPCNDVVGKSVYEAGEIFKNKAFVQAVGFVIEELRRGEIQMKFDSKIVAIGDMVKELLDDLNTLVIFNDDLIDELLKEISVLHTKSDLSQDIEVGDILTIGEQKFEVSAVGDVALQTLRKIGHCTIKFDGLCKVELSGEIHVMGKLEHLKIGDRMSISAKV